MCDHITWNSWLIIWVWSGDKQNYLVCSVWVFLKENLLMLYSFYFQNKIWSYQIRWCRTKSRYHITCKQTVEITLGPPNQLWVEQYWSQIRRERNTNIFDLQQEGYQDCCTDGIPENRYCNKEDYDLWLVYQLNQLRWKKTWLLVNVQNKQYKS